MATRTASEPSATRRSASEITFLFSDIEGSTLRWERDRDAMASALARHDVLMRGAIETHGGYVFKTVGDAFCAAFASPSQGISATLAAQRALLAEDFSEVDGIRVRMALHAGTAEQRDGDYFGPSVNRVARLLSIGHGGQVLISGAVAELVGTEMPAQSSLRDLGEHRLKDLSLPERVYQLTSADLPDAFPALRSLNAFLNNLPPKLTSFVGRGREASEIKGLLREHRLVTLTGAGGIGKTRCATQVGADLLDGSGDGVWLVELAPVLDPSLVESAIARALNLQQQPGQSLLDALVTYLKEKRVLFVLDNCEHVISEARRVAAAILRACPDVRILATSREGLHIAGERLYKMPPLERSEAVALFVDRARAVDASFILTDDAAPHVADICLRLDGIPLAIELAAARTPMLAPPELARRLDKRFRVLAGGDRGALPRQQTLHATIDWSFELLDEREKTVFRRLSIFSGGCTLEAAVHVCGDDLIDEWSVIDTLSSLVDKSLVAYEPTSEEKRYGMLSSIREYAFERLTEAGEADTIAEKHARLYASFVHDLQPLVSDLEDTEWRRRLRAELDNARAVVERTIFKRQQPEVGLSLLADLEWPELLTTPGEALRWFESAAELVDAMPNDVVYSRLLRHCVLLEWLIGRPLAEREITALRALDAARVTNDPNEIARALANLGACYRSSARFDEADRALAEAFKTPASLSRITTNAVLRLWAVTDLQRGEIELARKRFSQVALLERPGSEAHASALLNLGELEFAVGNVEAARDAARRAKDTYAGLSSVYIVLVLSNLAGYALEAGDVADAREHLREAMARLGTFGQAWLAAVVEHHALLACLLGDHESAALLAGFTDAHYASHGEVRQRTESRGYERLVRLLADAYDADELARRMRAGSALTEEQALAHAAAILESTQTPTATPSKE
jgi:predicted ATPase/class 3 adenylate cyclase